MSANESTYWLITEHESVPRENLVEWLKERMTLTGTPQYLVNQTIQEPIFSELQPNALDIDPRTSFAGRIFGPDAEIRWAIHGSEFDVWSIRDSQTDTPDNDGPYYRESTHYYCLGRWARSKGEYGEYIEGHISVPLKYPVVGSNEDDRFRVNVYEYLPAPIQAQQDLKSIVTALNRPRVIAARFYGVTVGKDG